MAQRIGRTRLAAVVAVIACHLALLAALMAMRPQLALAPLQQIEPLTAVLFQPPPPPPPKPPTRAPSDSPAGAPAAPARAEPEKPTPPKPAAPVRPALVRPPPEVEPLVAGAAPSSEPSVVLGEADLAGATVAGSGGGGSGSGSGTGSGEGCDMVRLLQDKLRKDPEVRSAASQAHRAVGGKAILVWNGEWLKNPGQDGKGLAGIRQAIAMEVAFAPAACRAEPMRGLVVIAFDDRPGGPKLALGSGAWRWTDLLGARRR